MNRLSSSSSPLSFIASNSLSSLENSIQLGLSTHSNIYWERAIELEQEHSSFLSPQLFLSWLEQAPVPYSPKQINQTYNQLMVNHRIENTKNSMEKAALAIVKNRPDTSSSLIVKQPSPFTKPAMHAWIANGDMEKAIELFQSLHSENIEINDWDAIIRGFAKKGLRSSAVKYFHLAEKRVPKKGQETDTRLHAALMSAFKGVDAGETLNIYRRMRVKGLESAHCHFVELIESSGISGNVAGALQFFYKKENVGDFLPNWEMVVALAKAFVKNNQDMQAWRLMGGTLIHHKNAMESRSSTSNLPSFSIHRIPASSLTFLGQMVRGKHATYFSDMAKWAGIETAIHPQLMAKIISSFIDLGDPASLLKVYELNKQLVKDEPECIDAVMWALAKTNQLEKSVSFHESHPNLTPSLQTLNAMVKQSHGSRFFEQLYSKARDSNSLSTSTLEFLISKTPKSDSKLDSLVNDVIELGHVPVKRLEPITSEILATRGLNPLKVLIESIESV